MASLQDIRKKIGAVKNTKKITKAMQLVATSKMRAFQKKALTARAFVGNLCAVLNVYSWQKLTHDILMPRQSGKTLFLLYSSDKGLCGKLNTSLAKELVRSKAWLETKEEDRMLITVGKKATEFAKNNNLPVAKSWVKMNENVKAWDLLDLIDFLFTKWEKKELKEIVFLSPHFKNTFTYYARMQTFLPLAETTVNHYLEFATKKYSKDDIFLLNEPDKQTVLDELLATIVKSLFFSVIYELKAAEYSSRMLAMQSANEAADKLINQLTLTYNKTRQQNITQQLMELLGAAEIV